ncbi:MAG: hypothetical protein L6R45_06525 [Anaerolineae bacterium]|nr:hypothetical protein [Anaerolineae bacterium]
MIGETGNIRVLFTVICGAPSGCPRNERLADFREKLSKPEDPKLVPQWLLERKAFMLSLQANHLLSDNEPNLIDLSHYQAADNHRDVFVGMAQVPDQIFARHKETFLLEVREPEGRDYLDEMFSKIFHDLNEEGDNDFAWLTWTIVPLVETLEGRFNPGGMAGHGKG